jgi:hypothetical protein
LIFEDQISMEMQLGAVLASLALGGALIVLFFGETPAGQRRQA